MRLKHIITALGALVEKQEETEKMLAYYHKKKQENGYDGEDNGEDVLETLELQAKRKEEELKEIKETIDEIVDSDITL